MAKIKLECSSDVLIVGSGIAGLSAAVHAAKNGSIVTLIAKGDLFSGSSFYPGTWGFGLIGPSDENDESNLEDTIEKIGCYMTDKSLVHTLVKGIHPAIKELEDLGVKLRKAEKNAQREFIPCFDYKHRDWNGLEKDSLRKVFTSEFEKLNIKVISNCEAVKLVQDDKRVCGAIVYYNNEFHYLGCKALVLASGGYGSLFKHHLCTDDVEGIGQSLALDVGCKLVNMEFMQVMPGYLSPAYGTVFNEKTFRFSQFFKENGENLITSEPEKIFDSRSNHGPFTCRLNYSKAFDLALFNERHNGGNVTVSYSEEMQKNPPEFVKTYFDWLKKDKGLSMSDSIQIAHFAHASNGGIKIDKNAFTGIEGLYACGEVTGGMHGADRLGGLSTTNGLVFGCIAGESASNYSKNAKNPINIASIDYIYCKNFSNNSKELQVVMEDNAMVVRNEKGLTFALNKVLNMMNEFENVNEKDVSFSDIAKSIRLMLKLHTSEAILKSSLMRKESRGSHYRDDYENENKSLEHQIELSGVAGKVKAKFNK